MRIKTNTSITPAGKVRVKTSVKPAPMLPTLRSSTTFSAIPTTGGRRRRRKRR